MYYEPSCRDELLNLMVLLRHKMAINVTIDSFGGATTLWQYPSWSWPVMQFILPQIKRVRYYRSRVAQMLRPVIAARMEENKLHPDSKPADMVQWLIDNSTDKGTDLPQQADDHIVTNVAAIHTTAGQLAHTIYDLARFPEYIPPLRQEIDAVIAEEGAAWDGTLTKQMLYKLKKMDSFLRETQRLNPASLISVTRKVLKPVKLSNGVELPAGTGIGASSACVGRDPQLWDNADEFDGFRFFKLREKEGDERYQFTSVNGDALGFGE